MIRHHSFCCIPALWEGPEPPTSQYGRMIGSLGYSAQWLNDSVCFLPRPHSFPLRRQHAQEQDDLSFSPMPETAAGPADV